MVAPDIDAVRRYWEENPVAAQAVPHPLGAPDYFTYYDGLRAQAEARVPADRGQARCDARGEFDYRLRAHHRALRVHRRRCRGDTGRPRFRPRHRQSRTSQRLDVSVRREARGQAASDRPPGVQGLRGSLRCERGRAGPSERGPMSGRQSEEGRSRGVQPCKVPDVVDRRHTVDAADQTQRSSVIASDLIPEV
jgi:hypothetical protein